MRIWLSLALFGLITPGAAAQDGATDEPEINNAAFVDLQPAGIQWLARARRASETGDPAVIAATYLVVAGQLALVDRTWVVPDPGAPRIGYLGVHEALRRQLVAEPPAVHTAWQEVVEPRARVALSNAGEDGAALVAVALRYPVCPTAVEALTRLGNRHLEAGRRQRAVACYRAATQHLPDGAPIPTTLARRLLVASRANAAVAVTTDAEGPGLHPDVTTWLSLSGNTPTRRAPAVTGDAVLIAGTAWVGAVGRAADGSVRPLWHWDDAPAAEQARVAADADRNAGSWADAWPSRWRGGLEVPTQAGQGDVPSPAIVGDLVVAVLGRGARAPRALIPVFDQMQGWARFGRWQRAAGARMTDQWDGAAPPGRQLVALRWRDAAPSPRWRLGGDEGIADLGPTADLCSAPVSSGNDVYVAALKTKSRREISAHLLRVAAATGRVRSVGYIASGPQEAGRGRAGAMLRVPPAMPLALLDGRLVLVTNMGVVAACDPETGAVLWVRRYPQRDRPGESSDARGQVAPVQAGDLLIVAPWDADECFALDAATGTERGRWTVREGRTLEPMCGRADGTVLALEGGAEQGAERLVALRAGAEHPEPVASAPDGQTWLAGAAQGAVAWLVGTDGIDRVDLASGDVQRAHWFGRDRPERVACAIGPNRLVVATDRHLHWFAVGP